MTVGCGNVKIKAVESDVEKSELDQLLWSVLWMPLNLPRNARHSFRLGKPEIEIIAVEKDEVVGGLVANRLAEDEFEIRHIAVCTDYQGHSVGRMLIQELIREVGKGSTILIRTYARNTSMGFFSRLGFVPEGDLLEHKDFIKHGIKFQQMCLKC
jgi:GNAT superfamily N-acetyltransferase